MIALRAHRRALSRPQEHERGSVLSLVALCLVVIVACTALTVDLGRVSTKRRDLQNVADAVALDLARLIDGRTATETVTDPRWTDTLAAALDRNGFAPGGSRAVAVAVGDHDRTTDQFTVVTGAGVPHAVRVEATDRVDHAFAPGATTTTRRAVAGQTATAGIQVGSFVARLDSTSSPLLSALVGDALGVTLVGYAGLAGGRVGLDELATELGFSLADPDQALTTDVTAVSVLEAQAVLLRRNGDPVRAAMLDAIVAGMPRPGPVLTLGKLFSIAPGGEAAAAVAELDVLEVVTATALVANGSRALAIPALGLNLPGGLVTSSARAWLTERPQWAFGPVGTSARTAQLRVEATIDVVVPGASRTTLTVSLDVAPATATIADIGCGSPRRLGVDVTTGLASARADIASTLVTALGLDLARVTAHSDAGQSPVASHIEFVIPPDAFGVARQVAAPALGLGGAGVTVDSVQVLGLPPLGGTGPLVSQLVSGVVTPLLTQVDAVLLRPLMSLVGLSSPGADVTPLAISCDAIRLVS